MGFGKKYLAKAFSQASAGLEKILKGIGKINYFTKN